MPTGAVPDEMETTLAVNVAGMVGTPSTTVASMAVNMTHKGNVMIVARVFAMPTHVNFDDVVI